MSSTRPIALLAGLALLVGAACAPAPAPAPVPVNTADDEAAIRDIVAGYYPSLNAGDLDGSVAMFAPDAIYLPNDGPAQRGEAAIRAYYRDIGLANSLQLRFTVATAEVDGDFAWATTAVTGSTTTPEGVETPVETKGLFVFRRDAPGWQVVVYMFNPVAP